LHKPDLMSTLRARAFERAARIGDGFLFSRAGGRRAGSGPSEPVDRSIELADRRRRRVAELGRDPAAFGVEGRFNYADGADGWSADLAAFRRGIFDYVTVNMLDSGLSSVNEHLRALEDVAGVVEFT
jgi:hypothetical protein